MRVLWFTNSPSLASDFLKIKTNGLGWIESLEKEISKVDDIELGLAFPHGSSAAGSFNIGNTKYYTYPYSKSRGGIPGFMDRWKHKIETEEIINSYLKIIADFKPDVVHLFGTESPFGLMIPKVKVPVVIQIQGNLTVCARKWYSGLSALDVFRFSHPKTIYKAYGLWHLYFLFTKRAERERKLMPLCKYYIGRTEWDRRITRSLAPSSEYFHCDELLRDEFYTSDRWQKPINKKIVLVSTVNSMAYKGLETILEVSMILKQFKQFDVEWKVAGVKGNEEIISIIEKSYKLKFSDSSIIFKGSINAEELLSELKSAHIYVHPSHIENSPNSVCEAMLIGMPVIATYAGGTPTMVTNNTDGLLIQDGDPYAMAGAIVELLEDDAKMNLFAENAFKIARTRHDKLKVISTMSDIYARVIENDRRDSVS